MPPDRASELGLHLHRSGPDWQGLRRRTSHADPAGAGIEHAVVNAGQSSIAAIGHPPDREDGWSTSASTAPGSARSSCAIPRSPPRARAAVPMASGDRGYGDIIDPHAAGPIESTVTVIVRSSSATQADASSTRCRSCPSKRQACSKVPWRVAVWLSGDRDVGIHRDIGRQVSILQDSNCQRRRVGIADYRNYDCGADQLAMLAIVAIYLGILQGAARRPDSLGSRNPFLQALAISTVVVPGANPPRFGTRSEEGYRLYVEIEAASAAAFKPIAVCRRDHQAPLPAVPERLAQQGQRRCAADDRGKWPHIRTNWVTRNKDVLQVQSILAAVARGTAKRSSGS